MKSKKTVAKKKVVVVPVPVPVRKGKAFTVIITVAVVAALIGQSVWVFYRDRKTQVTLNYEAAIAPRGQGIAEVTGCRHMGTDPQGDLFYLQGVGESSLLQKFARDGRLLARLAPDAPVGERLANGFAVAGAADGSAWVVERGTGAMKHYSSDKLKLLNTIMAPNGDLSGVGVGPDGTVWAVSFTGTLYALEPGASELKQYVGQKQGRLRAPFRLCFDPEGNIFVLDFVNGMGQDPEIKAYDAKFNFLRAWTVKDQPVNEFMCIAYQPQGYVVLNDTRPDVVDAKGFRLYTPKGHLAGIATLTNTGQNIRAIPGFAITPKGDWYLDMTPLQLGCGRLSWAPAL